MAAATESKASVGDNSKRSVSPSRPYNLFVGAIIVLFALALFIVAGSSKASQKAPELSAKPKLLVPDREGGERHRPERPLAQTASVSSGSGSLGVTSGKVPPIEGNPVAAPPGAEIGVQPSGGL